MMAASNSFPATARFLVLILASVTASRVVYIVRGSYEYEQVKQVRNNRQSTAQTQKGGWSPTHSTLVDEPYAD